MSYSLPYPTITYCHILLNIEELWVAFGTGTKLRYLSAHKYAMALGDEKARSLLFSHAFSGCDTVSFFSGRGKKTAWDVWMSFDESNTAFLALLNDPSKLTDECLAVLERFVVLLYDRTSDKNEECRNIDYEIWTPLISSSNNLPHFNIGKTIFTKGRSVYLHAYHQMRVC